MPNYARLLESVMPDRIRLTLLVIAVALTAACSSGPKPEIVGRSASELTELFGDYAWQVDCTVRNNGDSGQITVVADFNGYGGAWTKRETSTIGSGEERLFTFQFPEAIFQLFSDSSATYMCGWELP